MIKEYFAAEVTGKPLIEEKEDIGFPAPMVDLIAKF